MSSIELYKIVSSKTKQYTTHRYQIENDKFVFPKILETTDKFGRVFWMDFSENVSGTPKWEVQDAHFSKQQYSLHCTVAHLNNEYEYLYHLSDDLLHDAKMVAAVVESILNIYNEDSVLNRFKSDNCTCQYKCLNVFPFWRRMAIEKGKIFITYYGVSGHGKGQVDGMSAFGIKGPLRRAIITHDNFFNSANDIVEFLSAEMCDYPERKYILVEPQWERREMDKEQLEIKKCMSYHAIAYFPDSSIQGKVNTCACKNCIVGKFTSCEYEEGLLL